MDLRIPPADRALQENARAFTERWLYTVEDACEEGHGLCDSTIAEIKRAVVEAKLNAINQAKDVGGQGLTIFQQNLVNEELGKTSCGLWQMCWQPGLPLRHGTGEQIRTYLEPACLGQRRVCFAITEPGAGSDPRSIKTSARLAGNGRFRLSGEKWFVTSARYCDFMMVQALVDGDPAKPTLFFVDKDRPGVRVKREPRYMHTYVLGHQELVFEDVELDESEKILGGPQGIGKGFDFTKEWFVETRLQIGSHMVGAAIRATEIANAYASERVAFGRPIHEFQSIEFMLADMAVEIMAAKAMLYRVCWELDRGLDPRLMHARASAVKLYCSEMAGRVLDGAVQILGGRGYMRENPVERLYREVRVDRIWEGTSEIQRVIIAGQIKKRGLSLYTGWV